MWREAPATGPLLFYGRLTSAIPALRARSDRALFC